MPIDKIQQGEMNKRFEEFSEEIGLSDEKNGLFYEQGLRSFINEQVNLAVANREKEIVEMIESVKATKNDSFAYALEQFKKVIINLITKPNDKSNN